MTWIYFLNLFFILPGDSSVAATVAGGNYSLTVVEEVALRHGNTPFDEYRNPAGKAEFETRMAGLLLQHSDLYKKTVNEVSKKILLSIEKLEKKGHSRDSLLLLLTDLHSHDMGAVTDTLAGREALLGTIEEILWQGTAPTAIHLFLHQKYVERIAPQLPDTGSCKPQVIESNVMMEMPAGILSPQKAYIGVNIEKSEIGNYIWATKHQRPIDYTLIDERCEFVQKARIIHNMPLATGTYLPVVQMAVAVGNLINRPNDRKLYTQALTACWITSGKASAHEIMTGLQAAGWLPGYSAGNYRTAFPAHLWSITEVIDWEADLLTNEYSAP